MARAVRMTDYARAGWMAARRELALTTNALGLVQLLQQPSGTPDTIELSPEDPYSVLEDRGDEFLAGRLVFAGETLSLNDGETVWDRPLPSEAFARRLHGFDWLRDVKDRGETADATRLIDGWVARFGRWNGFAWSHEVLALRVINWLRAGPDVLNASGETEKARKARFKSLMRQVRYLQRDLGLAPDGLPRLRGALALSLAGLCLPRQDSLLKSALSALSRELKRQILPDGGHVSRSPEAGLVALIDLMCIRDLADARGTALPDEILKTIDRLAPMVRFHQLDDGCLASFHGGGESDQAALTWVLEKDDSQGRPFGFAPHSGYHRAHAGGATVILDAGDTPLGEVSRGSHASALALEMATPGGRLIVNCGWQADQPRSWREAVRASAAHSTLTLEETSSARLLTPGWKRDLLGTRLATHPGPVTARRNEEDMGIWLEGIHEGYRELFGLSHRRRVFLAADGGDLRGEDALFRPVSDGTPDDVEVRYRFAIRFHLHPEVKVSLSRDSMSAILVQPNGDGWRFRTDGGPVRLERSIYLAAGSPPQRATLIIVRGDAEPFGAGDRPPNRVRWAFQRLGRIGATEGEVG